MVAFKLVRKKFYAPMNDVYHISTPRLEIRAWQPQYHQAFREFVADTKMMRYITHGQVWTEDQVQAFFARAARNLEESGCCMGAVRERASGRVIGVGGLQPQREAGDIEVGWWISKDIQGKGYATELGRASLAYGFGALGLSRIVAIADPANTASLRVMEKIGMRYLDQVRAGDLEARYGDVIVARYCITREACDRLRGDFQTIPDVFLTRKP